MKSILRIDGAAPPLSQVVTTAVFLIGALSTNGQGTITFKNAAYFAGTNYAETGMRFQVIIPTPGPGSPSYDGMGVSPAVVRPWNLPYNSTPFMYFFRQNSPDDYVGFSLTNGLAFGLSSVSLADSTAPSLSPVAITFNGVKADNSVVSTKFTTPGGGANTFLPYQFSPDFASGLLSVSIDAPRWAMDNLVFTVPEPGTAGLFVLGLLGLGVFRWRARQWLR